MFNDGKSLIDKDNYKEDFYCNILKAKHETELGNHQTAEQFFIKAYQICPYSVYEYSQYSSCLWHLKRYKELAQISSLAIERHFFDHESWIAIANSFSLNMDHEQAVVYLKRAMQINPFNSYTYCLAGHEFSSQEQYEKSKLYYKKALTLDERNIRAYWGLGNLSLKTEKYEKAIEYFQQALIINPQSSYIYTQIAIAQIALQDYSSALHNLKISQQINPKESYNLFYQATCYFYQQKYYEAFDIVLELLKSHSKEPKVNLLMGQIYQCLQRNTEAQQYYQYAFSLDPMNNQKYKTLIEGLNTKVYQIIINLLL